MRKYNNGVFWEVLFVLHTNTKHLKYFSAFFLVLHCVDLSFVVFTLPPVRLVIQGSEGERWM